MTNRRVGVNFAELILIIEAFVIDQGRYREDIPKSFTFGAQPYLQRLPLSLKPSVYGYAYKPIVGVFFINKYVTRNLYDAAIFSLKDYLSRFGII
ncbi:hypothetical protein ASG50_00755 [Rhizobium sp. Leaf386]|nr:hypothetical protein ASG50_00755 [Rhizobium sp. Leaf386]